MVCLNPVLMIWSVDHHAVTDERNE